MQVGIVDCWFRTELNGKPIIDIHDFKKYYDQILYLLKKRPEVKLIVIGICPTSRKMENRYPGLLNQITNYNQVLKSGVDYQQVFFVDMEKHINPDDPHVYLLPDDHHLNRRGNELVKNELLQLIQAFVENEKGAKLYNQTSDAEKAYEHFVRSFQEYPDYVDNLYNLLYTSCLLGRKDQVLRYVKYVVHSPVRHPQLIHLIKYITGNESVVTKS